jgi:hypothetical protein
MSIQNMLARKRKKRTTENNNTIEIVKRIPSNIMFACNPPRPAPDTIFKEIYGIRDNKIQLIEKINGTHIPTSFQEEQIKF